jgi:hypothetical protein
VFELYTTILKAVVQATFESPLADAIVAGVALVRGWAFDTLAGEGIASVLFFVDGVLDTAVVCCTTRSDVQAAFPAFPAPNTLNSGWGNESGGVHPVRIDITTTSGAGFSAERTVMVVKPGGFGFLDQFGLSGAVASRIGERLRLSGVAIRNKADQQTATVNVEYEWQRASQQFTVVTSTVVAQASPLPGLRRVLAALPVASVHTTACGGAGHGPAHDMGESGGGSGSRGGPGAGLGL